MGKRLSDKEQKEKEEIQKKFGERLATLRQEKNITQENFAFELGVDRTYISYIERGKRNPSLFFVHKIANALGVKVKDILPF